MQDTQLDNRIAGFLRRKDAQFPGVGLLGRNETRTVKFPFKRFIHQTQ